MILRRLVPLALLLAASTAHAQIAEVYATGNFTHASNVQTGASTTTVTSLSGTTTNTTYQFTNITPVGIGGGVTLNFLPLPVIKLGIDLRGSTKPGTVGSDTALGGIKLTVSPPLIKPKFFIEGAVGYLATRTVNAGSNAPANSTFTSQYAIYQIIGGVDYPLVHFVDFRVEAAGGSSFGNGGFIGIGNSDGSSVKIFTVNTGFVVHF